MADLIVAELVAERPDLDAELAVAPLSLHPCTRFRIVAGGVERLDEVLEPVAYQPVTLPNGAKLLNATPDLRQTVIVDDGHLVHTGPVGQRSGTLTPDWRVDLPGADSATFLDRDRLLVTAPVVEPREHSGRRYQQNTTHRVLLMDTATGAIVDQVSLEVFDAGAFAAAHPADGSVLLDLGEGQDGSSVHKVTVMEDRLTVTRVLENVVVGGFSLDGAGLLLLPHPSYPQPPSVVSWPDLDVLAVADLDTAGLDPQDIHFYGCFLDQDRILLSTLEQGFWSARADLTAITPISLPAHATGDSLEFSLTMGLSADTFCTRMWCDGRDLTTVWRLRRSPGA